MVDRDEHNSLYLFKPDRVTAYVKPVCLPAKTQHTPSCDTAFMLDLSSSKNTISRYGTPVTDAMRCEEVGQTGTSGGWIEDIGQSQQAGDQTQNATGEQWAQHASNGHSSSFNGHGVQIVVLVLGQAIE